mmetsp:Transcript_25864/g.82145  ORF Transcript_25864/g.82145 Transcript_25864/m.82145 type:complete len:258 (+) Transcript_25864:2276-3049(+)
MTLLPLDVAIVLCLQVGLLPLLFELCYLLQPQLLVLWKGFWLSGGLPLVCHKDRKGRLRRRLRSLRQELQRQHLGCLVHELHLDLLLHGLKLQELLALLEGLGVLHKLDLELLLLLNVPRLLLSRDRAVLLHQRVSTLALALARFHLALMLQGIHGKGARGALGRLAEVQKLVLLRLDHLALEQVVGVLLLPLKSQQVLLVLHLQLCRLRLVLLLLVLWHIHPHRCEFLTQFAAGQPLVLLCDLGHDLRSEERIGRG